MNFFIFSLLFCSLFAINYHVGVNILSHNLDKYYTTSCYLSISYLVSRLTFLTLDQSFEVVTNIKESDIKSVEELRIMIENEANEDKKDKNDKYYVIYLYSPASRNDHYFLLESFQKKIIMTQSFQDSYSLSHSIRFRKDLKFEEFFKNMEDLVSLDENSVQKAIKNLFCYPLMAKSCEEIIDWLYNSIKHKKLQLRYINLKNFGLRTFPKFGSLSLDERIKLRGEERITQKLRRAEIKYDEKLKQGKI